MGLRIYLTNKGNLGKEGFIVAHILRRAIVQHGRGNGGRSLRQMDTFLGEERVEEEG